MNMKEAVSLAREKNNEGYAYLYEMTYQKNYYVALKYLKNEEQAMDVLQDSYVHAFKCLNQLKEDEKFPAWLAKIVATRSINEIRRKKPVLFSELEKEDGSSEIDSFYDDRVYNQPEICLDEQETKRLMAEIINTLSDEQRICVTMYYMEDMSVKEMAEVLQVSENTIKSRLNYARKKIKEKVLELEKNGTKLYGLAPVSFFLWLLNEEAKVKCGKGVWNRTANAINQGRKWHTLSKIKTAVLAHKTIVGVTVVSVVALSIGAVAILQNNRPKGTVGNTGPGLTNDNVAYEDEETEIVDMEEESASDILQEYAVALQEKSIKGQGYTVNLVHMEGGGLRTEKSDIPNGNLGYSIADYDKDGEDELLSIDVNDEGIGQLSMYEYIDGTVLIHATEQIPSPYVSHGQERWFVCNENHYICYECWDNIPYYGDGWEERYMLYQYNGEQIIQLADAHWHGSNGIADDVDFNSSIQDIYRYLGIDSSSDAHWSIGYAQRSIQHYFSEYIEGVELIAGIETEWSENFGDAEDMSQLSEYFDKTSQVQRGTIDILEYTRGIFE